MLAVIGYLICISLPRKSFAEILQVVATAMLSFYYRGETTQLRFNRFELQPPSHHSYRCLLLENFLKPFACHVNEAEYRTDIFDGAAAQ